MFGEVIPPQFIRFAADILGDTEHGLSGAKIVESTSAYAVEYDLNIPHTSTRFEAQNKRTALYENLMRFAPEQQYRIIKELGAHPSLSRTDSTRIKDLMVKLMSRYGNFFAGEESGEINEALIEETRHWLDSYLDVLSLYNDALQKYENRIFHRNLLDDLRLALELLLKALLQNEKSLENQVKFLGGYIKERGGSKELANMFQKLVNYYASYQNTYAKHDSAVIEEEIEFIFEITSSFMKHLVRLSAGGGFAALSVSK